jgi:hypothetical protein
MPSSGSPGCGLHGRRPAAAAQVGQRLVHEVHHRVGVTVAELEMLHQPASPFAMFGQACGGHGGKQIGDGPAGPGLDVLQLVDGGGSGVGHAGLHSSAAAATFLSAG